MVAIGMSVWSRQVISCKKSFLYFIKSKLIDFYLRDRPCFHFGFNTVLSMKAHRPTKLFHSLNLGRRSGLGNVYCNRNTNFISSICLQQKTERKTGVSELQMLYVVPHCRKIGIGKKLLTELTAYAKRKEMEKIILETSSPRTSAIRFYEKHGFKIVASQKILGGLISVYTFQMEI